MNISPVSSPQGFDRIARIYPWLEWLAYGNQQAKGRLVFLPKMIPCQKVLLLGEGNGRFLKTLLQSNPNCHVTVIEISPRMIKCAQQRLTPEQNRRVTWIQDSALTAALPPSTYDAIVTHYFFSLFHPAQQNALIQSCYHALIPGGIWQDTEFLTGGPSWYTRQRNRIVTTINYCFLGALCRFPARCLHNPLPFFAQSGFRLQEEQSFFHHFAARLWIKESELHLSN